MERDFLAELLFSRGQEPQRRKRGGLAGIWDRNKNIIKPVVSGALGLVNPALGAAAGAAMGGLDRPGKGGVGIDLGGAVRGGLEGYGAGAAASGLKGGIQGAMGAEGIGGRLAGLRRGARAGVESFTNQPLLGRGAAGSPTTTRVADPIRGGFVNVGGTSQAAPEAGGRGLSRALQFIRENPEATGMGLQAVSGIMGSQAERRLREQEQREERRRAQNLAMLVAPMYNPMGGR